VFSTRAPDGASPAATISSVNEAVIRRAVRARFVTMIYGVVDPQGELTYTNAGHNPPLLIRANQTRKLGEGGVVLGLFPNAKYDQETIALEPGDVIVAFSDGVSESMNLAGDEFGDDGIEASVRRNLNGAPAEILDRLLADVRAFSEGTQPHDDLTALVLRYGQPTTAGAAAS
jgi:sigma-B regulation protein RsbU (phosphoserine phosphatase)